MKLRAFSLLDYKVESYTPPFFAQFRVQAERQIAKAAEEKTSDLARFPDDFILYDIGEFDSDTGLLTPAEPASIIGSISEILDRNGGNQHV